jgi:general secretion pathway protein A
VYAAHFGLTERPFSLAPDPRYLFLSDGHREALAHLVFGLQGGGFVQLTGEVGTGKTTVCRVLLDQLPPEIDIAMIFTPRLTAAELLSAICDELRIEYPAGTTSLKVLGDALASALLDAHARGRRTVVIIDEAQNLSMEVLEELRLLTNLETTREKLLQVVLIGQPELCDLMESAGLRQLAQRVTARYHLQPFTYRETSAYVTHRIAIAGQRKPMFTSAALHVVHRQSGGVPRLINNICDRALLGAFGRNKRRVTAGIARRAAREVFGLTGLRRWAQPAAVAALLAVVVLGATTLGASRLEYVTTWWAQRLLPRETAPAPGTSVMTVGPSPVSGGSATASGSATPGGSPSPAASPVAAVAPTSGTSALLALMPTERDAALATQFALGGVEYRARAGVDACEAARRTGLRCLLRTGTWNVLRRLDLPATLTLTTAAGDKRYATVTSLGAETLTLDLAGQRTPLPLSDVERYWDGAFVVLWKAANTSDDVAWLRQRLPDGGADLRSRVIAFQRANGLTPDGVVGEETLVRLAVTTPGARAPSLSKATP